MQTLKNHTFTRAGRPGYGQKFWDELLNGQVKRIKKGVDFPAKLRSMVTLVYVTAKNRGKNVRIEMDKAEETLTVQAYDLPKAKAK